MVPLKKQLRLALYLWIGSSLLTTFVYAQFNLSSWPQTLRISLLWNFNFILLALPIYRLTAKIQFDKAPKLLFYSIHIITALIFSAIVTALAFLDLYLYPVKGLQNYLDNMYNQYFHICLISYAGIVSWFYFLHYVRKSREHAVREANLKQLAQEGELKALKAQINPHFLFNSLNSINSLVIKKPEKAREMVTALADTLRYVLDRSQQEMVTIGEELEFVKTYLAIEKIRFSDKLELVYQIDEKSKKIPFPPIILQPIVENSIKHGISNKTEGGKITIQIKTDRKSLICRIIDTGRGFTHSKTPYDSNNGMGLKNIRERLTGIYGESFSFFIEENSEVDPKETIATIITPLNK